MRLNKLTWAAIGLLVAIVIATYAWEAKAVSVTGIGAYNYAAFNLVGTSTDILLGGDIGQFRHCWQIYNIGANGAWCQPGTMTAGNAVATSATGVFLAPGTGVWGVCPGAVSTGGGGMTFQSPAFDIACISTALGTTVIGFDF